MDPKLREPLLNAVQNLNNWSQKLILIGKRSSINYYSLHKDKDLDLSCPCAVRDEAVTPPSVDVESQPERYPSGSMYRFNKYLVWNKSRHIFLKSVKP